MWQAFERERKGSFRCERSARGARRGREGGRETPARKPLFSPSRLLIMYAKITQLWMTSCQISLAAMRLFKSYFAYCFSFVFLKQEIWSKGTIKKRIKLMPSSVEGRKSQPCVACYIKYSINLLRFCWRYRVGLPNLHALFVGESLISPTNKVVVIKITTTLTLELDPAEHTKQHW